MRKTEAVTIWRGLSLYRQPVSQYRGSPYWYARVHMPINGRTIHTRSTKTTDLKQAERIARDFWTDCRLWSRGDVPMPPTLRNHIDPAKRFDRLVDEWLDEMARDPNLDAKPSWNMRNKKQVFFGVNGLATFFGREDIGTITTDRIRDYLRFQKEKSRYGKLAAGTQKKALIALGLILKHAAAKGLISHLPLMPNIKEKDSPRSWFRQDEYARLLEMAEQQERLARNAGDTKLATRWAEMTHFIGFMVKSFLRASEWASIQHKHIKIVGGPNPHLEIAVPKGKTGVRWAYTLPEGVSIYKRIVERTGNDPDRYVFLSEYANRTTASERMHDLFEKLLQLTDLKTDELGGKRVIHCLRHSAIMFALLDGVAHFVIANNAGTSVRQIERFYASRYTAAMNIAELHKTRSRAHADSSRRRPTVRPLRVAQSRRHSD